MANTTTSPNMNLPIPVVGVDPGPQYATDLNSCITLIDQHDHSAGNGVKITPSGLNVNTDLPLNVNNLTTVRTVRFTAGPTIGASDLNAVYVNGVDLYYVDGNGNQVRITQSGGVAGSPGSISNLNSPASAAYVAANETFVWQSAASTPANLDAGSIILRNITANSKGVTINPPNSLAANYSLTLPSALPGAQNIVTIDNSGNIATATNVDNSTLAFSSNTLSVKSGGITTTQISSTAGITGTQLASSTIKQSNMNILNPAHVALSSQASTSSTTPVSTSLSKSITTTGGAVMIVFSFGNISSNILSGSGTATAFFSLYKNGSLYAQYTVAGYCASNTVNCTVPIGSLTMLDTDGTSGSRSYQLYISAQSGSQAIVSNGSSMDLIEL